MAKSFFGYVEFLKALTYERFLVKFTVHWIESVI